MDDNARQALGAWADQIAALEPAVRKALVASIGRLANNRRLDKADRDFAKAQVDAIRRAVRRADVGNQRVPKNRKK